VRATSIKDIRRTLEVKSARNRFRIVNLSTLARHKNINMTTENTGIMASMRNAVARLVPAKSLTSRLPKFSESLISNAGSGSISQNVPTSVPWPKYAENGQYTSMTDLLKTRAAAKVIAIGEHHHQ
jgi:hypothetical protein